MAAPISRRTFLTTGAAAAGALLPGVTAYAGRHPHDGVRFTLNAEVLDGGEQVTSITLHTARLGRIDPASLTTGTFRVHAKATSPIPIAAGDLIFSEYDLDRPVTAVRLDHWGNIVLDLAYGEGQVGGGTLGYIVSKGRNVMLDLVYTITQNTPIALRNRRSITIRRFVQGRLSDPEVDAFSYHVSRSGMNYRLYSPRHGRRSTPPDEAGSLWSSGCTAEVRAARCPMATTTTRRRCGPTAVRWASPRGRHNGSSAAPMSWPRRAPPTGSKTDPASPRSSARSSAISSAGTRSTASGSTSPAASNGGYMTMEMTSIYRHLFAAAVPICGVVESLEPGGPPLLTDAELREIDTPTWLVTSRDDPVVPAEPNTIHAHDLIPGSLMTLYDHVIWNGHQFNGHWSWIYVARNDPTINGTHIWQWMAEQRADRAGSGRAGHDLSAPAIAG